MSVVIVGGNDRMARQYKEICESYQCNAKVFTQMQGLKERIGTPDLLVLFTGTTSHKMVKLALDKVDTNCTAVVRSHTSSASALRHILERNVPT